MKKGFIPRVMLLYPGRYQSTNTGSGVSVVQAHAGLADTVHYRSRYPSLIR
jgi:hypothetical protein